MGGATRLLLLLTTPLAALRHRPSTVFRHSLRPLSTAPHIFSPYHSKLLPIKCSQQQRQQSFHNQPDNYGFRERYECGVLWPEWERLINVIPSVGEFSSRELIAAEDEFEDDVDLSDDFARAANSCLAFARNRPDVIGMVSRRDIEVLVQNGSPFVFKSAVETERRMRSFLWSTGSFVVEHEKAQTVDLMKYILSCASSPASSQLHNWEATEQSARKLLRELADVIYKVPKPGMSPPEQYQVSDSYGQTRRPLGQNIEMKRGDWICPKCSFMNFARNAKCLECEEQRPKRQLTGGEWDCPRCNFFNYGRNMVCLRCDCQRPAEAAFNGVGSTSGVGNMSSDASKATFVSRFAGNEQTNPQWFSQNSQWNPARDLNNDNTKRSNNFAVKETSMIDQIPHGVSAASGADKAGKSNYVPFVPLPADMFAKNGQKSFLENNAQVPTKSSSLSDLKDTVSEESARVGENLESQSSSQIREREEEKSDNWFKKVTELHDVPDLPSSISDEDFPEIMPVRKGENRFVVSKKKDRSLTSPAYKRQQAMEQGVKPQYVPFVPFPPDYFAKKDKQQQIENTDTTIKPTNDSSPNLRITPGIDDTSRVQGLTSPSASLDSQHFVDDFGLTNQNTASDSYNSQNISHMTDSSRQTSSETLNAEKSPQNENVRSGWTGKSLEGSAVKEADPLDMSEEAKAERWFKRVAQIKDISELSQIPDEDFPSIMPMRKGVNRFVVSKRKTPLERRLTSPQYRKNLRVVSSDPSNKENESS